MCSYEWNVCSALVCHSYWNVTLFVFKSSSYLSLNQWPKRFSSFCYWLKQHLILSFIELTHLRLAFNWITDSSAFRELFRWLAPTSRLAVKFRNKNVWIPPSTQRNDTGYTNKWFSHATWRCVRLFLDKAWFFKSIS